MPPWWKTLYPATVNGSRTELVTINQTGRCSYVTHPPVKGDTEHYYCQRLNYDRTKSFLQALEIE